MLAASTAGRIRAAVAELGYIPDQVAGSLASRRRRLIALLVSDLAYPIFNEAIESITSGLAAAGSHVMLCVTGGEPARAEQLVTTMLSWRVDAVVAWAPINAAGERLLRRSGTTVVQICDATARPVDIGIGFVQTELGQGLARQVYKWGYRRPHFVATRAHQSDLRCKSFIAEWSRLAKKHPVSLQWLDSPPTFQQGGRVFAQLRQQKRPPDIAICSSDHLAQALIIEAQAAGLSVPGDLAVVGLGNSPLAAAMRPAITTVDIHTSRIAPEVLRVIDARIHGTRVPRQHINLGYSLVRRDSA